MNCEEIIAFLGENLVDWMAVAISIFALIFSMKQFYYERSRNRKEATIHAFDQLESNESIKFLFSCSQGDIDSFVKRHEQTDNRIRDQWDLISEALPLLEHFAVGINSKIYDLEILNRMAGNKIITVYNNCSKLLQHKRIGVGNEKNYSELENMVDRLKKLRIKNNQSIPQEPSA